MKGQITFTMIKPNSVESHNSGSIIAMIEKAGFRIRAMKMTRMTVDNARLFYAEHEGKGFFDELVNFMTSGPIVAIMLEKENAVADFRKLIGATDPKEAAEGTIRKLYAMDKTRNSVHGSDSDESAIRESDMFFSKFERY